MASPGATLSQAIAATGQGLQELVVILLLSNGDVPGAGYCVVISPKIQMEMLHLLATVAGQLTACHLEYLFRLIRRKAVWRFFRHTALFLKLQECIWCVCK